MGLTAEGRKKFTSKEQTEVNGKVESDADSRNANKCNVLRVVKLFVVYKGVGEEGVTCFKIANNQDGLVCHEIKLYWVAVVAL